MKKIFSTFILATLLMGLVAVMPKNVKAQAQSEVPVDAKSAILMDYNSGEIIFAKNENEKRPIASMCKIMTLLLAFEDIDAGNLSLDDDILVSEYAASMGGSQAFLNANDSYKLDTLLKTITIASANDSCVAVAERISCSVDAFVEKMNKRAEELGMKNTKFSNCTGLPKGDQYSTSLDVALMTKELIKHDAYFKYTKIWLEDLIHPDGRKTTLTNTNKLVRFYNGCDGGKTGYTADAGHCLSCTAKKGEMRLISVIIGSTDSKARFKSTSTLLDYGFNNYENKCVLLKDKPIEQRINIAKGKVKDVQVSPKDSVFVFMKKNSKLDSVNYEYELKTGVKAPISQGDTLGVVHVIYNGKVVGSSELLAVDGVLKSNFWDDIKKVIGKWKFVS